MLVLIVPCYNEAERLDVQTFTQFIAQSTGVHTLFIDDGSRDNTLAILERLSAESGGAASVLACERNSGKAEAVRFGVLHTIRSLSPQFVGYWDADLATPLDEIAPMLAVLEKRPELQMVLASRVKLLGRSINRQAMRHYLGRAFATAASLVLRLAVYDTQCGAKLLRVSPEVESVFTDPFLSRWIFDVEILARMRHALRLTSHSLAEVLYEYPLQHWQDVRGSKVKPVDFLMSFGGLLRIWWRYQRPG